mgnify:CR=1 FL=1
MSHLVAIVGRPNVGKSTLFNRLTQTRGAIVSEEAGTTRDRQYGKVSWLDREFSIVDTGGWVVGSEDIFEGEINKQVEIAMEEADVILFVVDVESGITDLDDEVAAKLRRTKKPVLLVANKADNFAQHYEAAEFYSFGLGDPMPISAVSGSGTGDLLDAITKNLPEGEYVDETLDAPRIAIVGRPNAGKSSLVNAFIGEERNIVTNVAGTTRDSIYTHYTKFGMNFYLVDTAGIRRKMHRTTGADYYASIRTQAAIEKAEVALVLIDGSAPLTEQDVRVVQQVIDAGRALVVVTNKWDLVDEERQKEIKNELERELVQIRWAPRINLAAKTGWHTNRIVRALDTALEGWETRIPTGQLNAFLGQLVAAHPHPLRGGKQPRILFGTQASSKPPRFVLFTTGFLDPGYRRFIERRLRETFGFAGTPVQISVRVRERRRK